MYAIIVSVQIAFNLIGRGNNYISLANNEGNNNKGHYHPREDEPLGRTQTRIAHQQLTVEESVR